MFANLLVSIYNGLLLGLLFIARRALGAKVRTVHRTADTAKNI